MYIPSYKSRLEIIAAKSFMLYTVGKLSAPESRKSSHFLWRVIRRDAMEHNKIDTVLLVWAATSVHNEIKTKVISSGYLSLIDVIWATINCQKLVFINIAMRTIFAIFSKIDWAVAMVVSTQFKLHSSYRGKLWISRQIHQHQSVPCKIYWQCLLPSFSILSHRSSLYSIKLKKIL